MKIISVFLIIIYLIQLNNAANNIDPAQKSTLVDLFQNVFGLNLGVDPSDYDFCKSTYLVCVSSPIAYEKITRVNFDKYVSDRTVNIDLSPLVDLELLYVYQPYYHLSQTFYNSLVSLQKLNLIYVRNQSLELSSTFVLPPNIKEFKFVDISVPLPSIFVESDKLEALSLQYIRDGFTFPVLTKQNSKLKFLFINFNRYFPGLPSNMNAIFTGIKTIETFISNDVGDSLEFPNLSLPGLESLFITFLPTTPGYSKMKLPSFFNEISSLFSLTITGDGLINDPLDLGTIDLSKNKKMILNLANIESLDELIVDSNSIKLPKESEVTITNSNFNLGFLDYSTMSILKVTSNGLVQELPTVSDPTNFISFEISSSNVYGDIPEEYCYINKLNIANNDLDGTIPECFLQMIIITGKFLGWVAPASSHFADIVVINANTKIGFRMKGVGKNLQGDITFANSQALTVKYSFIPPLIKGYTIVTLNGKDYLLYIVDGFDTVNVNSVVVNGKTIALSPETNVAQIYKEPVLYYTGAIADIMSVGQRIEISAEVGGQSSNSFVYYYLEGLTITDKNIKLKGDGGSLSIQGSYATTNSSIVTATIDGKVNCNVISVEETLLTISCPSYQAGTYTLVVNVGNNIIKALVEIEARPISSTTDSSTTSSSTTSSSTTGSPTTTTTSPTSTTTTSTTTGVPSSSDDEDEPSNSSTLNISFFLFCFIILIQTFTF